jgi:hypothetical protein
MLGALGYVHSLLFRLLLWLLSLPVKAVWTTVRAVLALLGEEFQRWAGLIVSGLLVFLAGKAALNYGPPSIKKQLVLGTLALVVMWVYALKRSIAYTRHNNLRAVRQRQWFRQVAGMEQRLGERFRDGAARTARGTPMEGMFRSNREERAREEEREAAAAEQAAAEREAAMEQERQLDDLADLEPSPY